MMRKTMWVSALCAALACVAGPVSAQQMMKLSAEGITGQPFTLGELGAIVVEKNEKLEILVVMPSEHRLKAYSSVDLQQGDLLLMLNGKRLKSIEDLKAAVEDADVGSEFKFGIRRGEEMMIVSYDKADPQDLPKMKTSIQTSDDDMGPGEERVMQFGGPEGPIVLLAGSGVIAKAGEDDGAPVVLALMDKEIHTDDGIQPQEGDVIVRLQGKAVSSLKQLDELFDALKEKAEVTLVFVRDETEHTLTFTKAKAGIGPGVMMIKK